MNRISIPTPIVHALGIKHGDEVSIYCDEEQKMLYVKFTSQPKIFDRELGAITTIPRFKNITNIKFKQITPPKHKKLTSEDNKIITEQ